MKVRTIAVVIGVLGCVPPPRARPGGSRSRTPDGASSDQVGSVRAGTGDLHVVWHRPTGPNTADLLHTVVTAAGALGPTTPVQVGWTGFTNPALVVDPGGLRAFWGGIRTTSPDDPNQDLNTAVSPDGGASWALQTGSTVQRGAQAYGSPISATARADGSTLQAWAGTLGAWVHAGLAPATPNHEYMASIGQYGYDPNLATDQAGRTVMAWYSSAAGRLCVLAQDVAADGSPVGAPATMPQTSDLQSGMQGRTPLVARPGGGFYVAYPTGYPAATSVRLWRVGAGTAAGIAKGVLLQRHQRPRRQRPVGRRGPAQGVGQLGPRRRHRPALPGVQGAARLDDRGVAGDSEFRARTADRQSRDVGCLLQGHCAVEDNSRKYDLPPLPCGQAYGP